MTLPSISIGKTDRERLVSLATDALMQERPAPAASMLLMEISRARIVSGKFLPTNVVAMHRPIEILDNIKKIKRRLHLVYPGEEAPGSDAVSILTPLGAALIGMPEGSSIEWCSAAGDAHSITVLRVWPGTGRTLKSARAVKPSRAKSGVGTQ